MDLGWTQPDSHGGGRTAQFEQSLAEAKAWCAQRLGRMEFQDHTLVCWVPLELVPFAQMGIDANPEECIRWAEE